MKIISTEKITEGLIVSQDIVGPSGQCLVSRGTVLTESIINSLKRHEITNIPVENRLEKKEYTDDEIRKAEEACREEVLERFSEEPADIMMKTIFKAALRIKALEDLNE